MQNNPYQNFDELTILEFERNHLRFWKSKAISRKNNTSESITLHIFWANVNGLLEKVQRQIESLPIRVQHREEENLKFNWRDCLRSSHPELQT